MLYRLSFKAVRLDTLIWDKLTSALTENGASDALIETVVPLFALVGHLCIFIVVTSVGKISLNLVASTNACPHLLFPFQFFDFVFLYSFFSLRSMNTALTPMWVIQQCVLQITIIMRNSGTSEAMSKVDLRRARTVPQPVP